jgi:hypothetical protein
MPATLRGLFASHAIAACFDDRAPIGAMKSRSGEGSRVPKVPAGRLRDGCVGVRAKEIGQTT